MSTTNYQPGVCNIGPAERRKRRLGGWLGAGCTAACLVAFVTFQVPDPWRVLIAIPAGAGANGFLQSALHFCVGFAMRGLYNLGPKLGTKESVMEKELRRKDQLRGLQIVAYSGFIAAVVVVVAVLLP